MRRIDNVYPDMMSCKDHSIMSITFSPKIHNFSFEETSDKPKMRENLQNNYPILFKSIKTTEDKDQGNIPN